MKRWEEVRRGNEEKKKLNSGAGSAYAKGPVEAGEGEGWKDER